MNKRDAKALAQEGTLSIGELRRMIAARRQASGPSKINRQFSVAQACDIFEAALAGRDDAEIPVVWKVDPYSRVGALKPARDQLTITNILIEAGDRSLIAPSPSPARSA